MALRALSSRACSEAQLRDRLARSGFSEHADEVIAWLRRLRYVDDVQYATSRARSLLAPGRLGPALAERRLLAAGVDDATARAAVTAAAGERAAEARRSPAPGDPAEPPEVTLCREALARKLAGVELASLDERARARLGRFLLGRGYSPAAVARAVGLSDE